MQDIPICHVTFSNNFDLPPIPELGAYSIKDLFLGIGHIYPEFKDKVISFSANHTFAISINGEIDQNIQIEDLSVLLTSQVSDVYLQAIPVGSGNVGKVILGVGILALGLTGVGLLGLSATTTGLLGASLVFNSIFKHPKTDNKKEADKQSFNHNGVINSVGGGQALPLLFGRMNIGSIVVSEQVIPTDAPV